MGLTQDKLSRARSFLETFEESWKADFERTFGHVEGAASFRECHERVQTFLANGRRCPVKGHRLPDDGLQRAGCRRDSVSPGSTVGSPGRIKGEPRSVPPGDPSRLCINSPSPGAGRLRDCQDVAEFKRRPPSSRKGGRARETANANQDIGQPPVRESDGCRQRPGGRPACLCRPGPAFGWGRCISAMPTAWVVSEKVCRKNVRVFLFVSATDAISGIANPTG